MGLPPEVLVAVMEVEREVETGTGRTTCGSSLAIMAPGITGAVVVVVSKEAEVHLVVMATPEDGATAGRIRQAAEAVMEITLDHSLLLGARRRYTSAIRRANNMLNQQRNLPQRRRRKK